MSTPAQKLNDISNVVAFSARVKALIIEAKSGVAIVFELDNNIQMIGADERPAEKDQSELLYEQLAIAFPERAFKFSKPSIIPGDADYIEFYAPTISEKGNVQVSTSENHLTINKTVQLQNGTTLPPQSKFAVGTVFDGHSLKSIDPEAKVWALTPEGKMVEVAGIGESTAMNYIDVTESDGKLSGQIAPEGSRFPIKELSGSDKNGKPIADPDGRPLIDGNAITAESFADSYKPGTRANYFVPKAISRDHFLLPENISVYVKTRNYGGTLASGANRDYFMKSGFADNLNAAAKNYTGKTDPRSARELMRARAEAGITGSTQVEAGLRKDNEHSKLNQ